MSEVKLWFSSHPVKSQQMAAFPFLCVVVSIILLWPVLYLHQSKNTTRCICLSHSPPLHCLPVCLRDALPSFWNADPDKYPRKLALSEWLYRGRAKAPGNPRASRSALKHLPSDRTAKRSSPSALLFHLVSVLASQESGPRWQREAAPSLKPTQVTLALRTSLVTGSWARDKRLRCHFCGPSSGRERLCLLDNWVNSFVILVSLNRTAFLFQPFTVTDGATHL